MTGSEQSVDTGAITAVAVSITATVTLATSIVTAIPWLSRHFTAWRVCRRSRGAILALLSRGQRVNLLYANSQSILTVDEGFLEQGRVRDLNRYVLCPYDLTWLQRRGLVSPVKQDGPARLTVEGEAVYDYVKETSWPLKSLSRANEVAVFRESNPVVLPAGQSPLERHSSPRECPNRLMRCRCVIPSSANGGGE